MKRPACYTILFVFLLSSCFIPVLGQKSSPDSYIDSLKNEVSNFSKKDSNYVISLLRLTSRLKFSQPEEAISYANQAVEASVDLADTKLQARAFNSLGIAYAQQNNYALSIQAFRQSMQRAYLIDYYLMIGQIRNNLGNIYKRLGNYGQSLSEYRKAEQIYDSLDNQMGIARVNNNLGNLYKQNEQKAEAIKAFEKALSGYKEQKNLSGYYSATLNLGIYYFNEKEFDHALPYLDSALAYYKERGQTLKEVAAENALGELYLSKGNSALASNYLNSALHKAKNLGLKESQADILGDLAKVESKSGNFSQAKSLAIESLDIANELNSLPLKARSERRLADMLEQMGEWKEALEHHRTYKSLNDSIFNSEQSKLYQAQQVEREVLKQEEQLKSQALQLGFLEERVALENKWKWSLIAASLFLLFAGILYYQKYRNRKILAAQLEIQNELISQQKSELETVDKAKTRFFTNISHEFRTPLNLILGPLRASQNQIPADEMAMMRRNAERLLRLINQLLDLSKLEAGQIKTHPLRLDIFKFLAELVNNFTPQAETKAISYQVDIPSREVFLRADPEILEQIVYNLLSNAFKFTPQGGRVSFYAGLEEESLLRMIVSDSGIGIPKKLHHKIFDRFYQQDDSSTRAFEGSGIGLALTKELIALARGKISLESDINTGARFSVLLPLEKSEEGDEVFEGEKTLRYALDNDPPHLIQSSYLDTDEIPLILIVEDNPELRKYLLKQLSVDFHCIEASNGREGLKMALDHIPELIISDIMMPQMDGIELTHRLKNDPKSSHIPVILLTAKNDARSRKEGFSSGADQYLAKPFDPQEIKARVQSALTQNQRLRDKYSQAVFLKPREIEIEDHEAAFLESVIQIIEEHMDDSSFSVSQLQEELAMSRMQVHRKLKALTGKSASEFIRNIRLQRASELLLHPGAQVADVAYRVGFSHLSYFAKSFKEQFGQVPSSYIKQGQKS